MELAENELYKSKYHKIKKSKKFLDFFLYVCYTISGPKSFWTHRKIERRDISLKNNFHCLVTIVKKKENLQLTI